MIIGVFSDAHGNEAGYLAARDALRAEGAESLIYLGDAVGYIPDPSVVRHVLADEIPWIRGNHEALMLAGETAPEREEQYQHTVTMAQLLTEEVNFLEALPEKLEFVADGRRCLFVHGSPEDPTFGYVYPDTDLSLFSGIDVDVVFMGNTHHPFIKDDAGTRFVNVGSCGLPRDDSGFGSAAIYDTMTGKASLLRLDLATGSRRLLERSDLADSVRRLLERTLRSLD